MANPDLDELLSLVVEAAQAELARLGGFEPFGISLNSKSEMVPSGVNEEEAPPGTEYTVEAITQEYREAAAKGELRAAAVCFDALFEDPGVLAQTDAICVRLEHESGECVVVYVPYKRSEAGEVELGEVRGYRSAKEIFV